MEEPELITFEIELDLPNYRSEFLDMMIDDFLLGFEQKGYIDDIAKIIGDNKFTFVMEYTLSDFETYIDAFCTVAFVARELLYKLSERYPSIDLKLSSVKIYRDQ